ncbi:MAG: 30S ribosomal protein S6 [Saprospiraceae bacterium]|nr:30S ribosomal protein S6 [Saprospiraceae bacterium]
MKNYEITFIVDPVLSGEEIKATAQTYVDLLTNEGCKIVHVDEMGLRQLAYPINKRTSGVYYCIEFIVETGELISQMELALRRDERIMRFLTVKLDKYGVKYNEDKRNGLIGTVKKKPKKSDKDNKRDNRGRRDNRDRRDRDNRSQNNNNKDKADNQAKSEEKKTEAGE